MGQRSRKRGRRGPPPAPRASEAAGSSHQRLGQERGSQRGSGGERGSQRRSGEERNAAVRAALKPLAPGERPLAVTISAVLAAATGLGNLIAYVAGAKIGGKHPAPGGIILFSLLMLVCAAGMWQLRYWAVLGFMALLAIIVTLFALLLVEASNLLGFLIPPLVIAVCGFLFIKLVRVLSRIQMPKYPGR